MVGSLIESLDGIDFIKLKINMIKSYNDYLSVE